MAVWLGFGAALRASTALISADRFFRAAPILVPASLLALGAGSAPALAQIVWSGPGTDFNTGTNWSTGNVPTSAQTAVFQGAGPASLTTSLNTQLDGIIFDAPASGYNLTLGDDMTLIGSVVNTSGNQHTINVASGKTLFFQGTAASGQNVNYIGSGTLVFDQDATGGNSAFTVGSQIAILGNARTVVLGSLSGASGTLVQNFTTNDITVHIGSLDTSTTFSGHFGIGGGAGALTLDKVGTGTLTLAGANMLAGTTITAGTLAIANGGTLGDGAVTNNAALAFNRTDTSTFANTISGSGTVTQAGSGTTILTGANTYSGTTTIDAGGTLKIGNGGTTGSLGAGAVTNNGTLGFNRSDALNVGNAITGAGRLLQGGAGVLTLGSANSYSGGTVIGVGTVALGDIGAIGTGAVTLAGGALRSNVTGSLANNIGITASTTGTVSAAAARDLTLTGDLTVGGSGALVFGSTTETGVVAAGFASASMSPPGSLRVAGGTLRVDSNVFGSLLSDFSSTTIDSGATLNLNGRTGGAGTIANLQGSGTLTNTAQITVLAGSFAGAITGSAGLFKTGGGMLVLSGTNTYSGVTTVSNGMLQIGDGGTTGTLGSGNVVVGNTLAFNRRDAALTVANTISGAGKVRQIGSGITTLTGALSYTGGTFVDAGRLVLGDALNAVTLPGNATIASIGALTLANGSLGSATITNGGNLSLQGNATGGSAAYTGQVGSVMDFSLITAPGATLGSLAGTGAVNLGSIALAVGGNDASTTFAGVIADDGALIKNGTGHLTLSGDSSGFAGSTQVAAGTLSVNGMLGGNLGVASGATLGGSGTIGGNVTVDGTLSAGNSPGTLTVSGDLTLKAGSTTLFELNAPGVIGGAGVGGNDLVKVGGALALGGTLDARVAAAGYYRLFDYGTLAPASAFATETISSTNAGFTIASHAVRTDIAQQVNLSVLGTGQTMQFWDGNNAVGNAIDGGSGTWQSFATNWTDVDGMLNGGWAGSVGIFEGAAGTVTVLGAQGFDTLQFKTDGYVVQGGALAFGVAGGATLNIDSSVATTIASTLQDGAGSTLTKVGGGTVVLSGSNTYTGGTTLLGGILSVSADTNLGHASGALSLDGGVLAATASFTSTRVITLTSGGFDVASGNTLGLTGAITGAGDLHKLGAGTLVLSGANAYGDTLVEAGILVGNAGSISGDIGVAAGAFGSFDQTANASFAGDIGGLNGGKGAMLKRGSGTLTHSGNSSLDWVISAGGLVSAAERFGGNATIATGASLAFTQGGNGTYAGTLSGAGSFSKAGIGTATLTGDSSAFTGVTTIAGGTLIVGQGGTGKLGGTLEVLAGGTLGGSGTVGTTTLATGSTLAPGNSVGTLTVAGDLVFAAGARFAVEVAPGGTTSDLVAVTGTATINGGNVAHIGMTGTYDPTRTYTILSAAGGVSGTFDSVTSDFTFLVPSLSHSANTVTLTLTRNDTDFADVAITRNQIATAGGLGGLTLGNALYDAVVQLDEDTARTAFDQLSGEIHASVTTGLITDSDHLRRAVNDRLRAAFRGVGGTSSVPTVQDGTAVWSTALGARGSVNSDGNATATGHNMGGLIAGADAWVGDQIRLGLLAGYSQSATNAQNQASSATIDSYHLGVYGGTQWAMPQGSLALRGGLAYSWHDLDTSRTVGFTGFADRLSASYNAGTIQVFGELGYGIETELARFEPFVNLAHVAVRTGSFAEAGGTAALTGASGSNAVTFTTVGVRVETDFDLGTVAGRFDAMVGWRHAFGDVTPQSTHGFAGTDAFAIAGSPIGRDALVLDAGLNFDLTPDASFGLSYQGQFASGAQDHGFKANLAIKF